MVSGHVRQLPGNIITKAALLKIHNVHIIAPTFVARMRVGGGGVTYMPHVINDSIVVHAPFGGLIAPLLHAWSIDAG